VNTLSYIKTGAYGCIVFLFSCFSVSAQTIEEKVDSIGMLITSGASDSSKVVLWSEIASITAPVDRIKNEEIHLLIIELCKKKISTDTDVTETLFYKQQLANSYTALGVNYFLNANFNTATKTLLNATQISKEIKAYDNLSRAYTVLGVIQRNLEDYPFSYQYLEQAAIYGDSAQSNSAKALAYNNRAINHLNLDSLSQAITYFQKTKQLYELEGNDRGIGVALINLGSCYKKEQKYGKAITMFKQSVELRERIHDNQGLIFSHHRLGETYLEIDQVERAKYHAEKSLELALKKGYPRGLRDANELLFKINKRESKSDKALYHYEQYIQARDSLVNKENIREIAKLEEQYIYAQKAIKDSLENAEKIKIVQFQLEAEKANADKQTIINISLAVILLLIIVLVGFVYSQYKKVNKQKNLIEEQKIQVDQSLKELAVRDEEKEILLKEIHHRVKNNLQVVIALLELQDNSLKDEQFSEAVKMSQQRVRSMAMIHELLYKNEDVGKLAFHDYLERLLSEVKDSYAERDQLIFSIQIQPDIQFDLDQAIPLGLIVTELFTNSVKYASDASSKTEVHITCTADQGKCTLAVRDNGSGLPTDFDFKKAKSLGIRLVHKLAKQLGGEVSYNFDQGAVFSVIFTHHHK